MRTKVILMLSLLTIGCMLLALNQFGCGSAITESHPTTTTISATTTTVHSTTTTTVSLTTTTTAGGATTTTSTPTTTTTTTTTVQPPTITTRYPSSGGAEISVETVVAATFSKAMASGSITTSNFTLRSIPSLALVSGSVSYDAGTNKAIFTPDTNLSYETTYIASVGATATDSVGTHMATYEVWEFTTGVPGLHWTQATSSANFTPRENLAAAVFQNKIWVTGGATAGGQSNEIWNSPDGVNWTLQASPAGFIGKSLHTLTAFGGKLYMVGGSTSVSPYYTSEVWAYDGTDPYDPNHWTVTLPPAAFKIRYYSSTVVFNNGGGEKLWIVGGFTGSIHTNEVWSYDGASSWTEMPVASSFVGGLTAHIAASFNNKIWVFSGSKSSGVTNEVWSSSNGSTWTKENNTTFSSRSQPGGVLLSGYLVAYGGWDAMSTYYNDVWYTTSGSSWTEALSSAPFSQREGFATVLFNNKIWVIGGNHSSTKLNDVWYSQ